MHNNSLLTICLPSQLTHLISMCRWGPGSIQNFTAVWLPLLPPSGPAPTVVQPGFSLQVRCKALTHFECAIAVTCDWHFSV